MFLTESMSLLMLSSTENPRECSFTRVVSSVEDIESLEILDCVACILKTFSLTEACKAAKTINVNLTEHEHSSSAGYWLPICK